MQTFNVAMLVLVLFASTLTLIAFEKATDMLPRSHPAQNVLSRDIAVWCGAASLLLIAGVLMFFANIKWPGNMPTFMPASIMGMWILYCGVCIWSTISYAHRSRRMSSIFG